MNDGREMPMRGTGADAPPIDAIEEDSHWWFHSRTLALLGVLDRTVGPGERPVLDVGCGAGNMMHHLRRYGPVVGVDPNPKPLAIARERGYDVREASGDALPFEAERFGLVAALDTLEHCPDDGAVLRECQRVLQPVGWLLVTVPAFMWLWTHNDVLNAHHRRYTTGGLRDRLRTAGFRMRYLTYNNFFVFPMAASLLLLRRLTERRADLASPHFDDDAYQVEMEPTSPWLNAILTAVGRVEATVLRRIPLPIGTSIIALAQKE